MKVLKTLTALLALVSLAGCSAADIASSNLKRDAEEFKINRRIVGINTITGEYLLEMQGNCSVETNIDKQRLEATCLVGEDQYKLHYVGLAPTVTYISEQLEYVEADRYQYKLYFKPTAVLPTIQVTVPDREPKR